MQTNIIDYDNLPIEIKDILNTFDDGQDHYKECERIIEAMVAKGYSADYGLDGILHSFTKLK